MAGEMMSGGGWCAPQGILNLLPGVRVERGGLTFDPDAYPPPMKGLSRKRLKRLVRRAYRDKRLLTRRVRDLERQLAERPDA